MLSALRYLQLFPDILGDPLPHQSLIGDSLLRGDLLDRQEIERIELDRNVPQFSFSISRENVLPERVIKAQRDFPFRDFTENASFIVILLVRHFFLYRFSLHTRSRADGADINRLLQSQKQVLQVS